MRRAAALQSHLLRQLAGIRSAQQAALNAAVEGLGGHVALQGPQPLQHHLRLIAIGLELQAPGFQQNLRLAGLQVGIMVLYLSLIHI